MDELPYDVQVAIEFTLMNWDKILGKSELTNIPRNFFETLPEFPMKVDVSNEDVILKINSELNALKSDPNIWFCLDDLPHEIWKDVYGYEGLYMVSNFGRVKSFHHSKIRIMSPSKSARGYLSVNLQKKGTRKLFCIQVLVARAFIANPENKPIVHHKDANPSNNCVFNLEWATYKENTQYALKTGRIKCGSENVCSKLSPEEIKEILETCIPRDKEFGPRHLAKKFKVGFTTIYGIINGERHI